MKCWRRAFDVIASAFHTAGLLTEEKLVSGADKTKGPAKEPTEAKEPNFLDRVSSRDGGGNEFERLLKDEDWESRHAPRCEAPQKNSDTSNASHTGDVGGGGIRTKGTPGAGERASGNSNLSPGSSFDTARQSAPADPRCSEACSVNTAELQETKEQVDASADMLSAAVGGLGGPEGVFDAIVIEGAKAIWDHQQTQRITALPGAQLRCGCPQPTDRPR